MRGDQIISKEIYQYFRFLLEDLYENYLDIPDILMELSFEYPSQVVNSIQYTIKKDEIVISRLGHDIHESFEYVNSRISPNIFSNCPEYAISFFRTLRCNISIKIIFSPESELLSGVAVTYLKRLSGPLQNLVADYKFLLKDNFDSQDFYCFEESSADPMDFFLFSPNLKKRKILQLNYDETSLLNDALSDILEWKFNLNSHLLSLLSSAKYEGTNAFGSIIKQARGYTRKKRQQVLIKFDSKLFFNYENVRLIRKLLEITKSDLPLLVTFENRILGLTRKANPYECQINILGGQRWDVIWEQNTIRFRDGKFSIASTNPSEIMFPSISNLSEEYKNKLKVIIQEAEHQNHGTLLIIGAKDNICSEVNRLCMYNRGIKISPISLVDNKDTICSLTAIDGAIMIDVNGICYGIGIILDGTTVTEGTPSRGARFNSAINYIKVKEKEGIELHAVIISEDKTIDMI